MTLVPDDAWLYQYRSAMRTPLPRPTGPYDAALPLISRVVAAGAAIDITPWAYAAACVPTAVDTEHLRRQLSPEVNPYHTADVWVTTTRWDLTHADGATTTWWETADILDCVRTYGWVLEHGPDARLAPFLRTVTLHTSHEAAHAVWQDAVTAARARFPVRTLAELAADHGVTHATVEAALIRHGELIGYRYMDPLRYAVTVRPRLVEWFDADSFDAWWARVPDEDRLAALPF